METFSINWVALLALAIGVVGTLQFIKKQAPKIPVKLLAFLMPVVCFLACLGVFYKLGISNVLWNFIVLFGFCQLGYESIIKLPNKLIEKQVAKE